MVYFICQEWNNTKGNHAGMVYLHEKIRELHPQQVRTFVLPDKKNKLAFCYNWLKVLITLLLKSNKEDILFFTECLSFKKADQVVTAKIIHKLRPSLKIWGMVHCIPAILEDLYPRKNYGSILGPFKYIVTLGSSLTRYFVDNGVEDKKVHTLFHYVDKDYYKHSTEVVREELKDYKLHCICMGNLGRDYKMLLNIVSALPEIHFDICKGKKDIDYLFDNHSNVTLHGFMSEDNLKALMEQNDVSLNIMVDTIGSNVICTSLAMGLAMVCSDVGSIRDYCDDGNAILCNNLGDFKKALNSLANNRERVKTMKRNSLKRSDGYSITKYYSELNAYLSK